jgi:UDP-glucose:(heptosyl)LPS alpha-1,3-glucosyltransferase
MNIAFCYESVLPTRGGCETYISDLARRLLADRHEVHLYACRWDEKALAPGIRCHAMPAFRGPRFLRPWRFSALCNAALGQNRHDVSIGFDKTFGQDVLYPQGGLHAASVDHNLRKHPGRLGRFLARVSKSIDLAHWSFSRLEKLQYLRNPRPQIIVNSFMVRRHFERYYGIGPDQLHVVRSAIDPNRFVEEDRPRRRLEWRQRWGLAPGETVGLLAAMNYRLKGLDPLLHAVKRMLNRSEFRTATPAFRLLVAGQPRTHPYRRMARRLGIQKHVHFVGHCPDMRNAYFAADFLVHPTFYDPCSLVVLEALACGLPIITTRFNGASELLHPLQEGYVIDNPHDHDHLAWCLAQMLDPGRRVTCAQAARRTAANWTFEDHYRQLLQVLQKTAAIKQAA